MEEGSTAAGTPVHDRRLTLFGGRVSAEIVRYALASGFSFFFILGCSALLVEVVGLPQQVGVAIALLSALVVNFAMLRVFVFPGSDRSLGAQFAATAVTSLAFRAVEYGIFLALSEAAGINYLIATGASVVCSAIGKFLVYRNVVFSRADGDAGAGAGLGS